MSSGAFPTKLLGCFAGIIGIFGFGPAGIVDMAILNFSLTAVAVRVLVGFNRVSIPTWTVRVQTDPAREKFSIHFCSGSRGTTSYCKLLAILIRSTSHSRSTNL